MKKIILILLLFPVLASMSQTRVVDRSGRQPRWVNSLEKDYIIVVGTGSSISNAQTNALNMVRENIVNAVAQNVRTTSEFSTEEANFNNNVSVYLDRFATTTTTESGPVSYLQGVTLSKVDDYYWEKIRNRATGEETYNYHIKYPFPEFELQKLVLEFNMRDRELTRQLEDILAQVDQVTSIEQIGKNIAELNTLLDYFVDGRKNQAQLGITRYRNLYNSIEIEEIEHRLGELRYALKFRDRHVHTSQRPQITSDCARITNISGGANYMLVSYDHENCYENPENHLFVRYRFGNHNVQRRFHFDVTEDKASVFVNDPIHLTAVDRGEETVESAAVSITLVSEYEAPVTVDKVVLEWRGHPPVIADNLAKSFSGKGNHSLRFEVNQPMSIDVTSSSGRRVAMVAGYIHYRSDVTGETKTYRFYNHPYTTNW